MGRAHSRTGMNPDSRRIVLDVGKGEANAKPLVAQVTFCESSASLQIESLTVHIPWSEMAHWQMWLANRMEEKVL
jgi:hypothetical protein